MSSWGTVKVLLTLLGPIFLPKVITCYREMKGARSTSKVRPLSPAILRALLLLFISTAYFILQSLPYFGPEEIFTITQSRLRTPNDVLFTRLSTLRPTGLTKSDKILKSKISSLDSRLLYLQHGPTAIIDCMFCRTEDPKSYFYHSIPSLLFPHLLNLAILGFVTSNTFTSRSNSVGRRQVTLAAVSLSIIDLYLVFSFPYRSNSLAGISTKLNFFFWRERSYRYLALACLNGIFGIVLYLSSTQRAFSGPLNTSKQLESLKQVVDDVRSKVGAVGVIQNTVLRDNCLRDISQKYWISEVELSRLVMEEKEVVERVKTALQYRVNMETVVADAEGYIERIMKPFHERSWASLVK